MNKHLIEIRYIPSTAKKPARISLTSHETDERIIIRMKSVPVCAVHIVPEAIKYLDDLGFCPEVWGRMKKGRFITVNEFKSLKS